MLPIQITILLVEDFLPDRELYRRYLEADEQYSYQIFETETGEEALSWCQEVRPDIILLDYMLPDLDGLEFIESLKQIFPSNLPTLVMLTGQGNEAVAIGAMKKGASDYLIKKNLTADILNHTIHTLLEERCQQELLQTRQDLVTSIGLRIRQYLTVSDIFQSTVEEVRGFLECDRVLVYEFAPDMSGTIVAESVGQGWTATLNNQIVDTCFQTGLGTDYQQERRRSIDNIYEAGLTECHLKLLETYQVKAKLVVPILLKTSSPLPTSPSSKSSQILPNPSLLWGLLIAHQCSNFRQWEEQELDLLEELAKQIALTLQPAFLFDKLQQENYERQKLQENLTKINRTLEAQVAERTQALLQSEQKFRSAFETAAVGMCLISQERQFLEVNLSACKILGYSEAELLNMTSNDVIHPNDKKAANGYFQKLLGGESSVIYEKRFLHKSGRVIWVLFSISLVRNLDKKPLYFISQFHNITERKQAEEAAAKANVAKSTFLASISHELRTPLNAILGFSQLLSRSSNLNQDEQENIRVISKSGEHLLNLINQVLDVTKNEAGLTTLNETAFDLYYLLEELEEMFQQKALSKKLQLIFEQANDVPQYVKTDAVKLRQILINILSNAIKFTQEGGVSVRISSQPIEPLPRECFQTSLSDLDPPQPPLERGENDLKVPLERGENDLKVPLERGENDLKVPLNKGDLGGSPGVTTGPNPPPQPSLERGENDLKVPLERGENDLKVPLIKGDLGGSTGVTTGPNPPPQPSLERGENDLKVPLERGENDLKVPLIKGDLGGSTGLKTGPNPPLSKEREECSPLGKVYFEIEDTGLGIAEDELNQLFQAFVQTQAGKQLQQGTELGLMISQQFVRLMGGEITVNSQVGSGSIFKFSIQVKLVEASSIMVKNYEFDELLALTEPGLTHSPPQPPKSGGS